MHICPVPPNPPISHARWPASNLNFEILNPSALHPLRSTDASGDSPVDHCFPISRPAGLLGKQVPAHVTSGKQAPGHAASAKQASSNTRDLCKTPGRVSSKQATPTLAISGKAILSANPSLLQSICWRRGIIWRGRWCSRWSCRYKLHTPFRVAICATRDLEHPLIAHFDNLQIRRRQGCGWWRRQRYGSESRCCSCWRCRYNFAYSEYLFF